MGSQFHIRLIRLVALALSVILLPATANALDMKSGSGIAPLRPSGVLIIGGISGASRSGANARNCYGSTLCRESGSYYSEHNILHYKNGEPLRQRSGSNSVRNNAPKPANNINHQQWCGNHFNSYRPSDNSYQPFSGSRKSCSSPFQ